MYEDVEARLRRYRPVAPPARLRDRCTSLARARTWPWAVACAAVLALAVTLQSLIHGLAEGRSLPTGAATEREAVNDLAEMLGGDAEAKRFAAAAVRELRVRAESTARGGSPDVSEREQ